MVIQHYNRLTHRLTKDLAGILIRNLKESGGDPSKMEVYAVYQHHKKSKVCITTSSHNTHEQMYSKGFVKLQDTSGVNLLIASNQDLQYVTNLEIYLYRILKTEEERVKQSLKRG